MKFATIAIVSICVTSLSSLDFVGILALLGAALASFGMVGNQDMKKVVAHFSVVHMAIAIVALMNLSGVEFAGLLSWHHHSFATCSVFAVIGMAYAQSGSRQAKVLFGSSSLKPVGSVLFLSLVTVASDLPWATNSIVELASLRSYGMGNMILFGVLVITFIAVVSSILRILTSYSPVSLAGKDIPTRFSVLTLTALSTVCSAWFMAILGASTRYE